MLAGREVVGGMLAGRAVVGGMLAGREVGGNGASSEIFAVGATRTSEPSFAPQPPQNRESGAFSVPQLGQRIPPSAYLTTVFFASFDRSLARV